MVERASVIDWRGRASNLIFFFQAEDGIRYHCVTGVQTCALPIYLLFGDAHSQIATLVERHTRYVMLIKLVDKDSYTVAAALARHARSLPHELYRSLTWDRGSEMAGHKRFTLATDIQVYFCDPHHPWQRGTNENT